MWYHKRLGDKKRAAWTRGRGWCGGVWVVRVPRVGLRRYRTGARGHGSTCRVLARILLCCNILLGWKQCWSLPRRHFPINLIFAGYLLDDFSG